MESKKGNVVGTVHEEINGSNPASGGSDVGDTCASQQEIGTQTSPVDSFYQKLTKLFESSGLSLLFNFRETSLDLYVFYKEVTERGGFHLVTKDGKWVEVASTLNSKSIVSMSPIQLQKLYAHFLYQFEQTYHYRTPAHLAAASDHSPGIGENSSASTRKRNHGDISSSLTVDLGNEDGPTVKKKCSDNSNQLSTGPPKKKLDVHTLTKKDRKKDPNAPLRSRSAYQLFLMKECVRLKKIHGENSASQNTRDMAIDAWRRLSESDRQQYVQESMKDKERFNREMTTYKECKNMPGKIDGDCRVTLQLAPGNSLERFNREMTAYKESKNMPGKTDGDCHVTLQLASGNSFIPDESAAELANRMMKNGQTNEDTLFQFNWDSYLGSLDLPF